MHDGFGPYDCGFCYPTDDTKPYPYPHCCQCGDFGYGDTPTCDCD
ncbi:hypothetical protein ACWEPM_31285 [Streptomyces sp. NPDC004244]